MNKIAKTRLKKFKLEPKYPHKRSEGMTRRTNAGSKYQVGSAINRVWG